MDIKRRILDENAACLHGIDIDAHRKKLSRDEIGVRFFS